MSPHRVFVYYRVPAGFETQVAALLAALQTRIAPAPVLLRRADDALTWMECYTGIDEPAPFLAALDAALAAVGWPDEVQRHLEHFVPLSDPGRPPRQP